MWGNGREMYKLCVELGQSGLPVVIKDENRADHLAGLESCYLNVMLFEGTQRSVG